MIIWEPNSKYDIKVLDNLYANAKQDLEILYELCSKHSPYWPLNYDTDLPSYYTVFIKPKLKAPLFPEEKYPSLIGPNAEPILELVHKSVLSSPIFEKKDVTLLDAYINSSTVIDSDLAHLDTNDTPGTNEYYTLLIYPNIEWDINWGGETLFYDNSCEEIVAAIRPKPGRVVLFNSSIYHSARPPQSHCPFSRYTIALKLKIKNE